MPAAKKPASRLLSIDDILAADDLPTDVVSCPEWGGDVQVHALTRKQALDIIDQCKDDDAGIDGSKFQILLVVAGMRLTEDRVTQLNGKHSGPIARIADRVKVLSGLDGGAMFRE